MNIWNSTNYNTTQFQEKSISNISELIEVFLLNECEVWGGAGAFLVGCRERGRVGLTEEVVEIMWGCLWGTVVAELNPVESGRARKGSDGCDKEGAPEGIRLDGATSSGCRLTWKWVICLWCWPFSFWNINSFNCFNSFSRALKI